MANKIVEEETKSDDMHKEKISEDPASPPPKSKAEPTLKDLKRYELNSNNFFNDAEYEIIFIDYEYTSGINSDEFCKIEL